MYFPNKNIAEALIVKIEYYPVGPGPDSTIVCFIDQYRSLV